MTEKVEQQPIMRIGFEAALDNFNAEWRTTLNEEQVNLLRLFYQSAMRDLSFFIGQVNQANQQMCEAYRFMDQNAVGTTLTVPDPAVEVKATPVVEAKPKKAKAKAKR